MIPTLACFVILAGAGSAKDHPIIIDAYKVVYAYQNLTDDTTIIFEDRLTYTSTSIEETIQKIMEARTNCVKGY